DGVNVGSVLTAPPYSTSWNTTGSSNTSHTLTAIATNGASLSTTSSPITVNVNNTAPVQITFVQRNSSVPQSAVSTVTVPFTGAQTAGNLNVVVVGWSDTTNQISSITDTKGNVYVLGIGPTLMAGVQSQAIYYAANIAASTANGNTVTVRFSNSVPFPDVRILEYSAI